MGMGNWGTCTTCGLCPDGRLVLLLLLDLLIGR